MSDLNDSNSHKLHYEEGFQLGYEMGSNNNSLNEILSNAYEVKGYVYKGNNPAVAEDANFAKFIEGAISGYTQHDDENPPQYHDLQTAKSNLIFSLGAIGVIALFTPIYIFAPQQTGVGVLLGLAIGGPILLKAIKASNDEQRQGNK